MGAFPTPRAAASADPLESRYNAPDSRANHPLCAEVMGMLLFRRRPFTVLALICTATAAALAAEGDVTSGPAVDQKTPALKVFDATGEQAGKDVDYTALRGDKPTVYMFIKDPSWSRPMARFVRAVDAAVNDLGKDTYVVAVWLTPNVQRTKEYLPKAQRSIKLQRTALCVYVDGVAGPAEWNVNDSADLTTVIAVGGKVTTTFGFVSVNETLARRVVAAVKKQTESK